MLASAVRPAGLRARDAGRLAVRVCLPRSLGRSRAGERAQFRPRSR